MSQYSRSNKNQKPEEKADTRPSRGEKVKQGLSVFQTVVATIASLLGIIVTSFTIMSLLNKDNQKTEDKPSSSTSVVVVHDKGSDSSATNTDANTNTQTNSSNTETSSQKETDSSSATETSSSAICSFSTCYKDIAKSCSCSIHKTRSLLTNRGVTVAFLIKMRFGCTHD